jgi:DNA recombination protein RmuC
MLMGMEILLLLVGLMVGVVAGVLAGLLLARLRSGEVAGAVSDAVVKEGLERLADQMRELEHNRATWQGQLHQQVEDVRLTAEGLRRETATLSTALRKPQVRGRWGEMQLRRAVEIAGLVDRCDFTEQHHLSLDEAALRPDMVIHLAGGKHVVVDSKVPLEAFLDLAAADDPDEQAHHLDRHARQVRQHVDGLGAKRYWRALPSSPEFVVLFLPGEAFLSSALDGDPSLIEYAARRQVVLATPTTLIALLKTVAHGWSHESLAERAQEIHELGRQLHERLSTMGGHFDRLGRSLGAAVTSYNQAIGSLEGRVLVSARRLTDLGLSGDPVETPRQIEATPRSLGAVELDPARRARGA